jgi:hypothetical protein
LKRCAVYLVVPEQEQPLPGSVRGNPYAAHRALRWSMSTPRLNSFVV